MFPILPDRFYQSNVRCGGSGRSKIFATVLKNRRRSVRTLSPSVTPICATIPGGKSLFASREAGFYFPRMTAAIACLSSLCDTGL